MEKYYEIVVFTAALQDYADWVLDQIDPEERIKYRLYRQHAVPQGGSYMKDISRIGRDIRRIIIVDNLAENFQLQPENGILIKSWTNDINDTALPELAGILKRIDSYYLNIVLEIVQKQVPDVRIALETFCKQMTEQHMKGVDKFHFSLEEK